MPEDLLHRLERHRLHDQPARAGVAQVVKAEVLDARFLEDQFPAGLELTEAPARVLPLVGVAEHVGAVDPARDRFQRGGESGVHGNVALAVALAFPDGDDPAREVDLAPLEVQDLVLAHPRVDRGDDDRLDVDVPQAPLVAKPDLVGREKEFHVLLLGQVPETLRIFPKHSNSTRKAFRDFDAVEDLAFEGQVIEAFQGGELPVDG
ncbi:MAG TPA: hypothetical protein VF950_02650 [Planctomycetota bacterium]